MAQYIVLSATEADAVRGETSPGHVLNPLPLTDGRYVLPVRVLEAPEHLVWREYLLAHGTVEDIDPGLFPTVRSRRP